MQGTTYWRWAICVIAGIPAIIIAYTDFGIRVFSIRTEVVADTVQGLSGFVAAALLAWALLPPARRTIDAGIIRAGELQRDWDAGAVTSSPWSRLHVDDLAPQTVVTASPRQAQRVKRALIRQGAALNTPILEISYRRQRGFERAVASARRRYTRLVLAGRKPHWESGRRAVYLIDLSSLQPTAVEVERIQEEVRAWEELWPTRTAVLFVPSAMAGSFPDFMEIRLQPDPDPVEETSAPDIMARHHPSMRGPIILATVYALTVTVLHVFVGLVSDLDVWGTVTGALPPFGLVLAVCWSLWPPRWARDSGRRALIAAGCLGVLMNAQRWISVLPPWPDATPAALLALHIWFALGSTSVVAFVVLLALRRSAMTRPVPPVFGFVWTALLVATWTTVAADPMLIALGLLVCLIAKTYGSDRVSVWALSLLVALIAVDSSLVVLEAAAFGASNGASNQVELPIIGSAVALSAATVLLMRPTFSVRGRRTFRIRRGLLMATGWTIIWAAASIPWALSAPSLVGLTSAGGAKESVVVISSLLSILLGAAVALLCRLLGAAPWVRRLGLALPVFAGLIAATAVPDARWSGWIPFFLVAVVFLAVLPGPTENDAGRRSLTSRNVLTALLMITLASFVLAALLPWLWMASIDLLGWTFRDAPGWMIPGPVRPVIDSPSEFALLSEVFRTPLALLTALGLMAAVAIAWFTDRRGMLARLATWSEPATDSASSPTAPPSFSLRAAGLVALAVSMMMARRSTSTDQSVQFAPLLTGGQNLQDLLAGFICIFALLWAWRWRHRSLDWLAVLLVFSPIIIGFPRGTVSPEPVIGFLIAALFVGGPSSVLAARNSSRRMELVICLGTVVICWLAGWLIAPHWKDYGVVGLSLPSPAAIGLAFLPVLIIRPGRSSQLSTRVDMFQRAVRRIVVIAGIGLTISVALSQLVTGISSQFSQDYSSNEAPWVGLLAAAGTALLLVLALYSWLHLRLLVNSFDAHNWRWSRYLRQQVSRDLAGEDESVATTMTAAEPHVRPHDPGAGASGARTN